MSTTYIVEVDGREVLRTSSLTNAVRRAGRYANKKVRIITS